MFPVAVLFTMKVRMKQDVSKYHSYFYFTYDSFPDENKHRKFIIWYICSYLALPAVRSNQQVGLFVVATLEKFLEQSLFDISAIIPLVSVTLFKNLLLRVEKRRIHQEDGKPFSISGTLYLSDKLKHFNYLIVSVNN